MNRSPLLLLAFLAVSACGRPSGQNKDEVPDQATPSASVDETSSGPQVALPVEEAVALPPGEFALDYPDQSKQEFLALFSGLRQTFHGAVLYAPGRLDLIDSSRSSYPRTSPLWQDTAADYLDDRVIARVNMPGPDTRPYYLIYTGGMSGDPAFYLVRGTDGERTGWEDADVIVFPDTGDVWIYQRTNSVFPMRRRIHVADGKMEEVETAQYSIGLRTVALKQFSLRRALDDSTVVASVLAGDSVEVVAGIDPPRSSSVLLVRTRTGSEGWVAVAGQQCNAGVIKGICFMGD